MAEREDEVEREKREIVAVVRPWVDSGEDALAWYSGQPLPSFGGQTAESLVRDGRADAVNAYLQRIALGGYA